MTDLETGVVIGMLLAPKSVGKAGTLKAAYIDEDMSTLYIVLTDTKTLTESVYTYNVKTITESVTTSSKSGGTTVRTTKSWTKSLIDTLYDASGKVVIRAVYSDETKGVMAYYLDAGGKKIYVDGSYTIEGMKTTETPLNSADINAVAIAYAIAFNQESANALQDIKESYRDGIKRGVKDGADTTEDYIDETDDPKNDPIVITTDDDPNGDPSGGTDDPYVGDLTDGLYFVNTDPDTGEVTSYVEMKLDLSYVDSTSTRTQTGKFVYTAYDADGNVLATQTRVPSANWWWKDVYSSYTRYVVRVTIKGSSVSCRHAEYFYSSGKTLYYNLSWSPTNSTIKSIMASATLRTNLPPTVTSGE